MPIVLLIITWLRVLAKQALLVIHIQFALNLAARAILSVRMLLRASTGIVKTLACLKNAEEMLTVRRKVTGQYVFALQAMLVTHTNNATHMSA